MIKWLFQCGKEIFPDLLELLSAQGHSVTLKIWEQAQGLQSAADQVFLFSCRKCQNIFLFKRYFSPFLLPAPAASAFQDRLQSDGEEGRSEQTLPVPYSPEPHGFLQGWQGLLVRWGYVEAGLTAMTTALCLRSAKTGLVKGLPALLIELGFQAEDLLCLSGNTQSFFLVAVLAGTEYQHLPSPEGAMCRYQSNLI